MVEMNILAVAILLVFWHCIADYPLQGDFMAQAKNKNTDTGKSYWFVVLPAHAMIHAGGVFVITGSFVCFVLELTSHAVIDYLKCENKITFNQDQALHIIFKCIAVAIIGLGA